LVDRIVKGPEARGLRRYVDHGGPLSDQPAALQLLKQREVPDVRHPKPDLEPVVGQLLADRDEPGVVDHKVDIERGREQLDPGPNRPHRPQLEPGHRMHRPNGPGVSGDGCSGGGARGVGAAAEVDGVAL